MLGTAVGATAPAVVAGIVVVLDVELVGTVVLVVELVGTVVLEVELVGVVVLVGIVVLDVDVDDELASVTAPATPPGTDAASVSTMTTIASSRRVRGRGRAR